MTKDQEIALLKSELRNYAAAIQLLVDVKIAAEDTVRVYDASNLKAKNLREKIQAYSNFIANGMSKRVETEHKQKKSLVAKVLDFNKDK